MSSSSSSVVESSVESLAPTQNVGGRALKAALVLSVLYALARLTGLLQASILGGLLPPAHLNAYWAAFTLPDIVNYLVAGGALSATFIPIFTQLETEGDEAGAQRFLGALLGVMGGVLALLLLVCWVFAGPLTALLNPGFRTPENAETLRLCVAMTRIMLPAQWFFYVGGILVAVLNARKTFGATGWTGAVYNLVAIGVGVSLWFLLWFRGGNLAAAKGFAWGILAGAFAGNFLLPLLSVLKMPPGERPSLRPNLAYNQAAVRRFWRNALPIMLGVSLPVVDQIVVKFFASSLPGASLAHLQTGNRVMLAPLTIVAQAASVAAFPFLSGQSAARDYQKLADFIRTGLRRLLFLTLPLSVILMLEARPIIAILFGYGEYARDPLAVPQTAMAFALYCVALFAWAGQQLVARGFYALQDTRTPTIIGSILTIFFFVPLCWAMAFWGVTGLALATSIGATAHFLGVLTALNAKLHRRPYRAHLGSQKILGAMLRTLVACVPMAAVGFLADRLASGLTGRGGDALRVLFVSLICALAFALCAQLLNITEWKWLRGKLLKK